MNQLHGAVFIFSILVLLSTAWGLCGLLKPKLVLWWAVPEKQTRARALGFALALASTFFFYAMVWLPEATGWFWLLALVSTIAPAVMAGAFRMTEAECKAQLEERARAKKGERDTRRVQPDL